MAARTAWHVVLASLLRERAPRRFEVRSEVPLSTEPLRADYLLLQTREKEPETATPGDPPSPEKPWKLWSLLPKDSLVEFKSIARPYRSRNLNRLWAYLNLWYADQPVRLETCADLAGVLLVAARTPSLMADVAAMGLAWEDRDGGYFRLVGGPFPIFVGEIDVVAELEDDDLLRLFGHGKPHTLEASRWFYEHVGTKETAMALHEMEGYDDMMEKFIASLPVERRLAGLSIEEILASLPPERRLAGLPPEQRLAGLPPDQAALALPDDVLRVLPEEYLSTLSVETRAVIRRRVGR